MWKCEKTTDKKKTVVEKESTPKQLADIAKQMESIEKAHDSLKETQNEVSGDILEKIPKVYNYKGKDGRASIHPIPNTT